MQAEYSSLLVQKAPLEALETGLCNENLVRNLCPLLRESQIIHEELVCNTNDFATTQAVRKAKIANVSERKRATTANASWVEANDEPSQPQEAPNSKQKEAKDKNETLLAEIKELEAHHNNFQEKLYQTLSYAQYPLRFISRGRGCGHCTSHNSCTYCMGCKCRNEGMAMQILATIAFSVVRVDIFNRSILVKYGIIRETPYAYARGARNDRK